MLILCVYKNLYNKCNKLASRWCADQPRMYVATFESAAHQHWLRYITSQPAEADIRVWRSYLLQLMLMLMVTFTELHESKTHMAPSREMRNDDDGCLVKHSYKGGSQQHDSNKSLGKYELSIQWHHENSTELFLHQFFAMGNSRWDDLQNGR